MVVADAAATMDKEVRPSEGESKVELDLSNMREFLTTPVPYGAGVVRCYIERKKAMAIRGGASSYLLNLKDGGRFLLAARKRKFASKSGSSYAVSMNRNDINTKSEHYIGKVRSNFLGTKFVVYDDGQNPKDIKSGRRDTARKQLGICLYASNVLGSRGPRKMRACVPLVDRESGDTPVFQPFGDETGMIDQFEDMLGEPRKLRAAGLFPMINKPPRWNDQVGAYVLNFNGRVTMASVKNFQLIHPEEPERVVLQFGRVAKDKFTMDFMWPMTPTQGECTTATRGDFAQCSVHGGAGDGCFCLRCFVVVV